MARLWNNQYGRIAAQSGVYANAEEAFAGWKDQLILSIENVPARYRFDKSKMIWKDLNEGRVRGFYVFFDYKDGEISNIRLQ